VPLADKLVNVIVEFTIWVPVIEAEAISVPPCI